MTVTIGLVANLFQEANALPGWLETHSPYFDDIRVLHAGPGGAYSNDGTIEILEKWRIPVEYTSIDEGFGIVRTKALLMSPCDYIILLDADERFYPLHRYLWCRGEPTPPDEVDKILRCYDKRDGTNPEWGTISELGRHLHVQHGQPYDQGAWLKHLLEKKPDAVISVRRHWHDLSFKRPTQHWGMEPDWQMRIVRNDPTIYFDPDTKMHERLLGVKTFERADLERGPFKDHMHFHFKRMEPEQRRHDVAIFDSIHEGKPAPMICRKEG